VDRLLNLIKWIAIGGGVYVGTLFMLGFKGSHLK